METYSSRPFISHDGPDEKGIRAEVKVIVGFGYVDSIESSNAGKAAKIAFRVDNTEFKTTGWVPKDDPVMNVVNDASGEPIHFRVEVRRKNSVDRTIPISEILPPGDMKAAKDNTFRSLVAVKKEDDNKWTQSPMMMTNMAEDPSLGGAKSANDFTLDELRAANPKTSSNTSNSPKIENPPFVLYNNDGEINPGSVAVSVPLTIYNFVCDYVTEHKIDIPDKNKIVATKAMIKACNELQLKIYDGKLDTPDLTLGSHTRARALVFESTKHFFPFTEEIMTDMEKLSEWKTNTVEKSLKMWRWSISEIASIVKED